MPSSALGHSGWSRGLGVSSSLGDGWGGTRGLALPPSSTLLGPPRPQPQTPGVLDGSCPGDRGGVESREERGGGPQGWTRRRAMGGGGHTCGTRPTLQIKDRLPVCCPLSERGENSGVGSKVSTGGRGGQRSVGRGGSKGQGAAGLGVAPSGFLPLLDSSPQPSSLAPRRPRAVLRLRLGLSQAERCWGWAGG